MPLHEPTACTGQPCCIHNPSDHHMVDWPKHWRSDRYLMERTCPHGIGHPDPDHMAHMRRTQPNNVAWGHGVHGCDGCCAPPEGQLPGGAFTGIVDWLKQVDIQHLANGGLVQGEQ